MNDDLETAVDDIRQSIDRLFGRDGQLSAHVANYAPRTPQIEMAKAITPAVFSRGVFLAEAGTGTGKTFSYLAPALLSGQKIIISTGTKTLQDQIFYRDLPLLCKALDRPVRRALLKGRNNYLCHYHLDRLVNHLWDEASDWKHIDMIRDWSTQTRTGDKTELPNISEDDELWARVTSTADNCLMHHCPHHAQCHILSARKAAMAADIVVVNHHLFFADWAMRGEKLGQLLPRFDVVIFDEAHQLPDIARQFMSTTLSTARAQQFLRDLEVQVQKHAADSSGLIEKIRAAQRLIRNAFEQDHKGLYKRLSWEKSSLDILPLIHLSYQSLQEVAQKLFPHQDRAAELAHAYEKINELLLQHECFIEEKKMDENIRWVEYHPRGFTCVCSPLNIGASFKENFEKKDKSWIFCSATLSIHRSFAHFSALMGIDEVCPEGISGIWDSTFDYKKQARLYIPSHFPDPSEGGEHTKAVVALAERLIQANPGGSFLLFTTHRALQEAASLIRNSWNLKEISLFVQKESGKTVLLEQFRRSKKGVLLGTQTFWEGIDVRGSALTLVIIDKIPFSSPEDPVVSAQIEHMKKKGGQPFLSLQVPAATLALKQGAGRLIRDHCDHGVLVITDRRLKTKFYGKIIQDSLPPMTVSASEEDLIHFLRTMPL